MQASCTSWIIFALFYLISPYSPDFTSFSLDFSSNPERRRRQVAEPAGYTSSMDGSSDKKYDYGEDQKYYQLTKISKF